MRKAAALLMLATLVVFTGCVSTQVPVSNTIPYEVQQNIRTAESSEVAFKFVPHPASDVIEAKFAGATTSYPINGPMKGMFQELAETKFRTINDAAGDMIAVELVDVETNTSGMMHELGMTVKVTARKAGTENSREFSYSSTMEAIDQGSDYTIKYSLPREAIQNLMVKFVVATDKFIDSNFGTK